jgi:hypothetical protein
VGCGPNRSRWLLTPCALRLREPHRTARPLTSFLSLGGATARAPSPAFAAGAARLSPRGAASRRVEDTDHSRGISTTMLETQDAFHRLDARPCDRVERFTRSLSRSRANRPAPFSPGTTKLASSETEPPCHATSRRRSRLWETRGDAKKMLLTDFCNRLTTRAPVDHSILERVAFTDTDVRCALLRPAFPWTSAPFAAPAPRCLSAHAASSRCAF